MRRFKNFVFLLVLACMFVAKERDASARATDHWFWMCQVEGCFCYCDGGEYDWPWPAGGPWHLVCDQIQDCNETLPSFCDDFWQECAVNRGGIADCSNDGGYCIAQCQDPCRSDGPELIQK
jgi:hypothetical protein